jgi:hypothetical protein
MGARVIAAIARVDESLVPRALLKRKQLDAGANGRFVELLRETIFEVNGTTRRQSCRS